MIAQNTRVSRDVGLVLPGDLHTTWMIACRAALESLRDRTTLLMSAIFALVVPCLLVLLVIRPQAGATGPGAQATLSTLLAVYLLVVGLLPVTGAVNVASGLFAGEKEKGNLAPLLATPASNRAIFGGKVLGAVLPSLCYACIAIVSYLVEVMLLVGPDQLRRLPLALSLTMVLLVPTYSTLEAAVASLMSSRARTYQGAQMITNLLLLPIMAGLFALAFSMRQWGAWWLFLTVAVLVVVDIVLIIVGAATWRREEVMARL